MSKRGDTRKKLNDVEKEFILRCLACGFTLQDTADFCKDQFRKEITWQNVQYYERHYKEQIRALRDELAEDILREPLARKEVRVNLLSRIAMKQFRRRQFQECTRTLRQIAEETGAITQKVDLTSKGKRVRATAVVVGFPIPREDPTNLENPHTVPES